MIIIVVVVVVVIVGVVIIIVIIRYSWAFISRSNLLIGTCVYELGS